MTEPTLSADNFAWIARLVREACGLVLEPGKEYLVTSRLTPISQRHGFARLDQFINELREGRVQSLNSEVMEAMVTTETSFFRDVHPFESLQKSILPELIASRRATRQLNIWCAASSSGQEPYSLAILLREHFPELRDWRIQLWATDISAAMLERAQAGIYSPVEINRGLSEPLRAKWFRQEGNSWQVDERLRSMITFVRMNLIQPWPSMPLWDLVLLRNVMIYFDNQAKMLILDRMIRALAADGYLLLGGAETTLNLNDSFARIETHRTGFYRQRQV